MSKTYYLKQFLEKVQDDWIPAQGLLLLLHDAMLSEALVQQLIDLVMQSLHSTESQQFFENREKQHRFLQALADQEKQMDETYLDDLLATID